MNKCRCMTCDVCVQMRVDIAMKRIPEPKDYYEWSRIKNNGGKK